VSLVGRGPPIGGNWASTAFRRYTPTRPMADTDKSPDETVGRVNASAHWRRQSQGQFYIRGLSSGRVQCL